MFEGVGGGSGFGGAGEGKGIPAALGRKDVGTCYTRGPTSRRWFGWLGRFERGGGEGDELELRHRLLDILFRLGLGLGLGLGCRTLANRWYFFMSWA